MSNSSSRKSSTKTSRKTAEDYSKLSQREHVLLRPDTYIGSIENDTDVMDIYNQDNNQIISQDKIAENKTFVFMDTKQLNYSYVAEIRSINNYNYNPP